VQFKKDQKGPRPVETNKTPKKGKPRPHKGKTCPGGPAGCPKIKASKKKRRRRNMGYFPDSGERSSTVRAQGKTKNSIRGKNLLKRLEVITYIQKPSVSRAPDPWTGGTLKYKVPLTQECTSHHQKCLNRGFDPSKCEKQTGSSVYSNRETGVKGIFKGGKGRENPKKNDRKRKLPPDMQAEEKPREEKKVRNEQN